MIVIGKRLITELRKGTDFNGRPMKLIISYVNALTFLGNIYKIRTHYYIKVRKRFLGITY